MVHSFPTRRSSDHCRPHQTEHGADAFIVPVEISRSEEHTSELQSHHPISYAVFCLKKKKRKTPTSPHVGHGSSSTPNNKTYRAIFLVLVNLNLLLSFLSLFFFFFFF